MDLHEVGWRLADLLQGKNTTVFLRTDPEVLDHTTHQLGKLLIETGRGKLEIPFGGDAISIRNIKGILDATIFNKEQVRILFGWNFKSLMTYLRFHIPTVAPPEVSLIDLQVVERFLGITKKRPETFVEAVNRARVVSQTTAWKSVYQKIHQPLMVKVLPAIETTPLLNVRERRAVYPYYEIEGQTNGRLSCFKRFGYLPHNMGPSEKEVLKPRGEGYRFLCADYRSCEVLVLQWLSKDKILCEIIESGKDLHSEIYRVVTKTECDSPAKRKISKGIFLPVMYGCGPETLANRLSLPLASGQELVHRVRTIFSGAYDWVCAAQEQAKVKETIQDFFGRRRSFAESEAYLARNFVVQGVAATFCLEKLIQLYAAIADLDAKIVFSVHDGFGMIFQEKIARDLYKLVKHNLESPSRLCEGLKIETEIKFGVKLSDLRVVWKD
jgi:hypothetical protein